MSKRVLTIQDLSCLGKCSLTVALPVLSAMGCETTVLPTEILSTHTGFPAPVRVPLTGSIVPMADHWASQGAGFDAVTVGYLSDPRQAAAVEEVLNRFPALTVIDPALGDNGRLYAGVTAEQVQAMAGLCRRGACLLPNLTEAAFLTGHPFREDWDEAYLQTLAGGLLSFGPEAVIITGLRRGGEMGVFGQSRDGGAFLHMEPYVPRRCHGTGDLFTAAFTGGLLNGKSLAGSVAMAARFVGAAVRNTPEASPFGVRFEEVLPFLWQQRTP